VFSNRFWECGGKDYSISSIAVSSSSLEDEEELDEEDELEELLDSDILLSFFSMAFLLAPGGLHITHLSRKFISRARIYICFSFLRRSFSHLYARRFLPFLVCIQTLSKFPWLHTFSVIAMVVSKFKTACHHPPGTNTVSPGYYMHSMTVGNFPSLWCSAAFSLGQMKS